MKTNNNCLLCEGKDVKLLTTKYKGYKSPDLFSIYHCPFCNTSYSIPRVDTNDIYQMIYKEGCKVPGYDRYWEYQKEVLKQEFPLEYLANADPVYWGIKDALKNKLKIPTDAKIIEIGCGLGYLTYSLQKSGFHSAFGLDISQEAVQKAKNTLGDYYICADLFEYVKTNKGSFDIVILTEVIEHVENPMEFISSLLLLLKDTGTIIMTTPNKSFFPDKAVWNTDLPPVHCWWFSEDSIHYMAKSLGLNCSFTDFTQYYKTHTKLLYNSDFCVQLAADHIFDEKGKLTQSIDGSLSSNYGILPKWIKKTKIYKVISRELYPRFSGKFIVSGTRTYSLCVLLTKKDR